MIECVQDGEWRPFTALVDCGSAVNCINARIAKDLDWRLQKERGLTDAVGRPIHSLGSAQGHIQLKDSTENMQAYKGKFHSIADLDHDFYLGIPWLKEQNPQVDWHANNWRFPINLESLEKPLEVSNDLDELPRTAYVAFCRGVNEQTQILPVEIPDELRDFEDVFSSDQAGALPDHSTHDHAIDLKEGKEPPFGPLYNLSEKELGVLREYLDQAMQKGWIQHSKSPAGAHILFVPKKDGSLRLCVDYRSLNEITIKNRHPLPLIDETLVRLAGAKYLTKLDLKDAYHRLRIKKGDEWKTAFRTRYGHFQYHVMPFGLANAPASFQAYINKALVGLLDVICVVYLDDILIYSTDRESHLQATRAVLQRLRDFKLYVNLKKCKFAVEEVEFLGFIVGRAGIRMDASRVSTVSEWPEPKSVKDIQTFLGFTNFYRRFIEHYSSVTAPLTELLRKDHPEVQGGKLALNPKALAAFQQLKVCFQKAPLLSHFDPTKEICVETDASIVAIAGILSQKSSEKDEATTHWRPVAFYSRKLQPVETRYETHDQELLAIVESFQVWRHFLEGSAYPIRVITDHNNLRYFRTTSTLTRRQARWAIKLAAFDFEIFYRAGTKNPADAPSRRPDYGEAAREKAEICLPTLQEKLREPKEVPPGTMLPKAARALEESRSKNKALEGDDLENADGMYGCKRTMPRTSAVAAMRSEEQHEEASTPLLEVIQNCQKEDALAKDIISQLTHSRRLSGVGSGWTLNQGILRTNNAIYVPKDQALINEIMHRHHDDRHAGHYSWKRTKDLIARKFFWKNMEQDIHNYVQQCILCQRTKPRRHTVYGELSPLPIPQRPFQEITMDFVTDLPPSKVGSIVHDAILVVVDRYTKAARYIPVTKDIDAVQLSKVMYEEIFLRYGWPEGIISDRGSVFTSAFWAAVCHHTGIQRKLSTAFHPQTDGQTERQNSTMEQYLRCYCEWQQDDWAELLLTAEFAYNSMKHTSSGLAPYEALYGYLPQVDVQLSEPKTQSIPEAKKRVQEMQSRRKVLEDRLRDAQESQAKYANKRRQPMSFDEGTRVMLNTKNIRLARPSKKLSEKFIGPFTIIGRCGTHAYKLRLPATMRIHPVFHVSLLEKAYEPNERTVTPAYEVQDEGSEDEVEKIVDFKIRYRKPQYLVKWKGWGHEYNEYMTEDRLSNAQGALDDFKKLQKERRKN